MLIALLSSAFAADLVVRVTSSSGVAASLTFHDVERTKTFGAPRVTVNANEMAQVKQGASIPVPNTDPTQFVDSFRALDLMVSEAEAVPPPALPAPP